jgi:hypothetical protein
MSDDRWLRELAQVNRDQHEDALGHLDERWDRLSRGELSPEEDAELRALAETSEEARAAYEAFRPLGPGFQAGVVQAIREQGRGPDAEPASPAPPAKLLPFRRRALRLAGWGTAVAATLAATVTMLLLRPAAPLPDYTLADISGGTRTLRSGEPEAKVPVLAPGDRFEVLLRPARAAARGSRLEALCVLARGGELHPLETRSEIDPGGAVRMTGSLGRDIPPGAWTLRAVVGRRGKLPEPAALVSLSLPARERDWVAVGSEILIRLRTEP